MTFRFLETHFSRPTMPASTAILAANIMVISVMFAVGSGCSTGVRRTDGTMARHYPYDMPIIRAIDVQVFRDGTDIDLANHTAHTYENFDLWLNERFVRHVHRLRAGEVLRLSLYEFVDEHGEGLSAGGLFSSERPDPIVKAEIETSEGMIGLVAIPDPDTP